MIMACPTCCREPLPHRGSLCCLSQGDPSQLLRPRLPQVYHDIRVYGLDATRTVVSPAYLRHRAIMWPIWKWPGKKHLTACLWS